MTTTKQDRWYQVFEHAIPKGITFRVPARNQGQLVEVAYGSYGFNRHVRVEPSDLDPFKRVTDRTGGEPKYYANRFPGMWDSEIPNA